jgi:hypothetical protein
MEIREVNDTNAGGQSGQLNCAQKKLLFKLQAPESGTENDDYIAVTAYTLNS